MSSVLIIREADKKRSRKWLGQAQRDTLGDTVSSERSADRHGVTRSAVPSLPVVGNVHLQLMGTPRDPTLFEACHQLCCCALQQPQVLGECLGRVLHVGCRGTRAQMSKASTLCTHCGNFCALKVPTYGLLTGDVTCSMLEHDGVHFRIDLSSGHAKSACQLVEAVRAT